MSAYLIIKTIHILSSVLLVGTGFGSAFYLFFANRSNNLAAQAIVARLVVRADWWFTTPTVIVQPISGFVLAYLAGFPLSSFWILGALLMYVVAGVCWLPVVWLQIQMEKMLQYAVQTDTPLPKKYWVYAQRWELLGYPAFVAMLAVFYLMVAKPM
ncbi:hypothetical protein DTO96_102207 [Ephemeroptericola cinctiostellae]|uniref:DUF2269 domain-containing protein n=1 Tax=Ephemeroptericola cinctiostellae TaxID=2268024 RepID=A0A345DDL5_9BURK|nr:DUF2269 domain-containing protein [Ephemeroptericola cinctiostellae]AXF86453.1 hypothetical protein DTO96_102207 [Ephemeroptericola cinctiostellae]